MDKWTNINHRIQKQFGITLNEYAIANSIYHLSYPDGWCTAKKEYLGEHIGISKQSVFKILKNLIEYGLVEREKKSLRTTEKWNNAILETQASDPAIASNFSAKKCQKKVKKVDSESKESLLQKVKKVDSESKESLLQKVKKVDSESKESLLHNNNSIYTDINTVIIADKSAEDIPAKYFHKKLIPTFFAGYKSIYNEKLIFSKKEIGCIHTLVQTKILKYSTFKEQKETTRRKIELLRDIAVQKNPFQNWQFLPSQLLQHWDQLVEGCVKKIKGNRVIDLKSNLADWEKIEREYEAKHV